VWIVAMALPTASLAASASPAGKGSVPQLETAPHLPGPVTLTRSEADSLTAAILRERADTQDWLQKSPSSYLATVQRRDFGSQPTLTVGKAPDNDVRLFDPHVMPHHLRVTVVGDSFQVVAADTGARFSAPKDSNLTAATLPPTTIGLARYKIRLSHQRFPALIVFDPKSPRFKLYKGIEYFPVDLKWRFAVPLTPSPNPDTIIILSTRGNQRRAVVMGWFEFAAGGTPCRLTATRLLEPGVGENDVSVFFRDQTTGKETYPVGRYVDPEKLADGRYLVDFNLAYSPACAYSEHYNCPIPPHDNRLPVAVKAGEMDPHYIPH
jgi:uncharacterized protein (DUF1684 family)